MKKTGPLLLAFFSLLILSAIPIFYKFNIIPSSLALDELEFAHLTMLLKNSPYVVYSTYATGHATLYFYILLSFFTMFGVSEFILRLPAALFGWVNGVVMFFILYSMFKYSKTVGSPAGRILLIILGTLLFIFCRWQFQFARFAFETTFLQMLELVSLIFFIFFLKNKKLLYICISALFAGLCFHSYIPGRIFFLVPLIGLLLYVKKDAWKYAALFLLVWAVVISPLQIYLLQNPDIRIQQQSYLSNGKLDIVKKLNYFGQNIVSTAGMFAIRGDVNGRHNYPNKPALNASILLLSLLGMWYAYTGRVPFSGLFLIYFVVALIPTLFTYPHENPNMLRTATAVPSIIFFATLGIANIVDWFEKRSRRTVGIVLSVLLVVFSILYDVRTYFHFQSEVFKESFEIKGDLNDHLNQSARPSL